MAPQATTTASKPCGVKVALFLSYFVMKIFAVPEPGTPTSGGDVVKLTNHCFSSNLSAAM